MISFKNINQKNTLIIAVSIIVYFVINTILDFGRENEAAKQVASIAILMSLLWISEAVPLFVTALFPLILFPITGVMKGSEIAPSYINSTIFLFLGGFLLAIAMEEWNLHKRIAYSIIRQFKNNYSTLVLGFMSAAFVISMWISNTATALMLLPIGLAVVSNLSKEKSFDKIKKSILLGIAYGCSIGGISTLIGTPPNLVFQRIYKMSFPEKHEILFGEWMIMILPLSIIMLLIAWLLLTRVFFKPDITKSKNMQLRIGEKLSKLSFEEKIVLIVFSITVFLWIFRGDIVLGSFTIPGWSNLFSFAKFIDDSTIAIFMSVILFIFPAKIDKSRRILNASSIKKIPWDIILLFGGGFALAEGFITSGLSEILGNQLKDFSSINLLLLTMVICFAITFLTELTSNTASAQIILPILAALSIELNINPLLIMIPATISTSMAFMLPVATPPNAIVFSSKEISVLEMAKVGFFLNIIGAVIMPIYFFYVLQ